MGATEPGPHNAGALHAAVRDKYREVADCADDRFPYPVGRESIDRLGYEAGWLDGVSAEVIERFVGVGNPFRVHRPQAGDHVLDLGSGCGFDVLVAAQLVGAEGRAVGVDLTPEMLEVGRRDAADRQLGTVGFVEGLIEDLPFEDGTFDVAISNGVLNLVPDKDKAFREIHRVLKPGGILAAADLVVTSTIPDEVLASMDAWST